MYFKLCSYCNASATSTIQLCMCTVRFSWWWLCPYCGRETSQALSVVTYPSHVTRDKCSGIICVDIVTYVLFIQRQSSSECLLLGAHFCLHLWCIEGVFQFVSIAASRSVLKSLVTLLLNSHPVISQVICSMRSTIFVDYVQHLLVCSSLLLTAELLHRKLCFTITFPPFICSYFNSLTN